MYCAVRSKTLTLTVVALASLLPLLAVTPSALADPDDENPSIQSEKIVGPDRCSECHQAEHSAWMDTAHRKGFLEMHRRDAAKAIASKLGIRRIKTAESCVRCHYTSMQKRGKIRAADGVSCESCHGAAKDWVDIHDGISDLEGKDDADTARMRQAAIELCKTNGMRRPDDIYALARSCFACHVIDDPELVEVGGHGTGDAFELLAWSQGEIRHNYLESAGAENEAIPDARKRVLYVLGQALDLEHTLRALSQHPTDGALKKALVARATTVRERLIKIRGLLPEQADLPTMLATLPPDFATAAQKDLAAGAATVQGAARRFAARENGEALAAIDSLLPDPATYRGKARK